MTNRKIPLLLAIAAVFLTGVALSIPLEIMHAQDRQTVLKVATAVWAVGPPLFFLWEWASYSEDAEFKGGGRSDGKGNAVARIEAKGEVPSFATFRYSQELAAKLWAAVLLVLTAFVITD